MKKEFENPEMKLFELEETDIITTSGGGEKPSGGENDLPFISIDS